MFVSRRIMSQLYIAAEIGMPFLLNLGKKEINAGVFPPASGNLLRNFLSLGIFQQSFYVNQHSHTVGQTYGCGNLIVPWSIMHLAVIDIVGYSFHSSR